ncbi:MAG: hypothetical protein K8F36_12955 [Melioribacteraceae bacterium]|nr:hypothetical protein [Melioribacteraceae bacterium]
MQYYNTILAFHILFGGMWFVNLVINSILNKRVKKEIDFSVKKNIIAVQLVLTKIIGAIGAGGILITGILLVSQNPGYGFFVFSSNHWLVSKQIIMVILLVMIFAMVIPQSKSLRTITMEAESMNDEIAQKISKLNTTSFILNILVVINILFALSHRFMG